MELQLDVRVTQQAVVNISQFPSYIHAFMSYEGPGFYILSPLVTSPPGKNGRNYRTFFTIEDIEMKEGKILRPKPLDMSTVRAQVGPAHSFLRPLPPSPRPGGGGPGAASCMGSGVMSGRNRGCDKVTFSSRFSCYTLLSSLNQSQRAPPFCTAG